MLSRTPVPSQECSDTLQGVDGRDIYVVVIVRNVSADDASFMCLMVILSGRKY